MSRSEQRGITLIELMVAMAIVAILAAIVYPSYQSQVRKSRRAAAQAFLMDVAARQHQRLLDVRSYASTLSDLNMTLPRELDGFYTIEVDPHVAPLSFTLTAKPVGAQAKDACHALTLDQAGHKTPDTCW